MALSISQIGRRSSNNNRKIPVSFFEKIRAEFPNDTQLLQLIRSGDRAMVGAILFGYTIGSTHHITSQEDLDRRKKIYDEFFSS